MTEEQEDIVEMKSPVPFCRAYRFGECFVLVGKEPTGVFGRKRWHLSISHPERYPTWDEIREARYRFIPDAVMVGMLLPPQKEYVNLHENCFHLYEID